MKLYTYRDVKCWTITTYVANHLESKMIKCRQYAAEAYKGVVMIDRVSSNLNFPIQMQTGDDYGPNDCSQNVKELNHKLDPRCEMVG